LPSGGKLGIFRAAAAGDLGPGCYVLKTCSSTPSQAAIGGSLLKRETAVATEVNHPSLIPVLASSSYGQKPHLVLPYLEGITLRQLFDSNLVGPSSLVRLPVSYALCIIRQLASALAALHAAGWLHGQVFPRHVMMSPQAHATLIDLTQCRRLDSGECDLDGTIPAAPEYAPPESFSRSRLTAAADVYSLGVVLFEAIAGRRPFAASSPRAWTIAHRREAPPDIRAIRADASLEVGELVRGMLAKEPLRRPSADQIVRWAAELEIEELATL